MVTEVTPLVALATYQISLPLRFADPAPEAATACAQVFPRLSTQVDTERAVTPLADSITTEQTSSLDAPVELTVSVWVVPKTVLAAAVSWVMLKAWEACP